MAAIYTFQLARHSTTSTALASLGIVPSGEKWVVKNVVLVNGTTGPIVGFLYVRDQDDYTPFVVTTLEPNTTWNQVMTQALEAGMELFCASSLPNLVFNVGGFRFLTSVF